MRARARARTHSTCQCLARRIVPAEMQSLQWQFWAIFAASDSPVELIQVTGVSYAGTACEVKMPILESTFPNIAVAETFQ
jgi:hypothetical protein